MEKNEAPVVRKGIQPNKNLSVIITQH